MRLPALKSLAAKRCSHWLINFGSWHVKDMSISSLRLSALQEICKKLRGRIIPVLAIELLSKTQG